MLDSTVDDAVYNVDDVTTPASIMHQVTVDTVYVYGCAPGA